MGTELRIVSETTTEATLRGYGVVWEGHDRVGSTFLESTDLMADLVPVKPVLIEHTLDGFEDSAGEVSAEGDDDLGHWVEMKVDKTLAIVREYLDGIRKGMVGLSTGAIAHMVRRVKNVIVKWPIAEVSLTKYPAEPRTLSLAQLKRFNLALASRLEAEQENRIEPDDLPISEPATLANKRGNAMPDNTSPMDGNTVTSMADLLAKARAEGRETAVLEQQAELKRMKDEQDADAKRQAEMRKIREEAKAEAEAEMKSVRRPSRVLVGNKWKTRKDFSGYKAPEQTEAFLEWARTGDQGAYKSLLESDSSTPEMPIDLYERIVQKASERSIMRLMGATIRTTDRPSFDIAYVSAVQASASAVSEGAAISAAQPTYAKKTVTLYKAGNYIPISRESLQDEYFDLEGELVNQIGRSIAARENTWLFAGVGTTEPWGALTRATLGATIASGQFSYQDMLNLFGAIPYEYLADDDGAFAMNQSTLFGNLAGLTTSGYLVASGVSGVSGVGQQNGLKRLPRWEFLGRGVYEVSSIPATAPGNKVALFGAFGHYFIGQKAGGPEVIRNEFEDMNHGLVRFYFTTRIGGDLAETDSVQYLVRGGV